MTNDDDGLPVVLPGEYVFNIDYCDLNQVKALAKKMGLGHAVIKFPNRPNYNVTHTWRLSDPSYREARIIFQT